MGNSHQELISEIKELMTSIQNQVFALESKLAKLENSVKQDNNIEDDSMAMSIEDFVVPVEVIASESVDAEPMPADEAEPIADAEPQLDAEPQADEAEPIADAEPQADEAEPIAEAEPMPADEAPMAEAEPQDDAKAAAQTDAEPMPADEAEPIADAEPQAQLFEEQDDASYEKFVRTKHKKAILDATTPKRAVVDAMISREAWRQDMPGSEVRDVRSAISLNDRVLFINLLFKEDATLFHTAMNVINQAEDLNEVVAYFEENYPDWNFDSELVYRFMMAARRKVR